MSFPLSLSLRRAQCRSRKGRELAFILNYDQIICLIHNRDSSFMYVDDISYGIKGIATYVKAPDMNAIAERFVRSIRSESLDNFIFSLDRVYR